MFRKKYTSRILIFITLILSSCRLIETEQKTVLSDDYYTFNPDSILIDFKSKGFDVFTSIDQSQIPDMDNYRPVTWTSEDYLDLLNFFHSNIWNEDTINWEVSLIYFKWDCSFQNYGPQEGHLHLVSNVEDGRLSSELFISPSLGYAIATRIKYSPSITPWQGIDTSKSILSPEEILTIAEANGGQTKRELHENDCQISVFYNKYLFDGWQVVYSPNTGTELIIKIDPTSGEIISIK
jgi:hypothetical protein